MIMLVWAVFSDAQDVALLQVAIGLLYSYHMCPLEVDSTVGREAKVGGSIAFSLAMLLVASPTTAPP